MFDLSIVRPLNGAGPIRLCIENCDKDGTLVSARLASVCGGVSSTRPMDIVPDRYFDNQYFSDMGNKVARYYRSVGESELLNPRTLVLGSVHPATLYIAEVLHASVLPLQLISFAKELREVATSNLISIVGSDYGVGDFWIWNKIADRQHFPEEYVDAINIADDLFVVRSTDFGEDCAIEGKVGNAFVNSTLRTLNPTLWSRVAGIIDATGGDYYHLRQWEWGLPDATVEAIRSLWSELGKEEDRLHIIESGTVGLYKMVPSIWEAYLKTNNVRIRGCTLNAYWTSHPYYERYAGLIPVHFYKFSMLEDVAHRYITRYCLANPMPQTFCVFANNVGGQTDLDDIRSLITHFDAWEKCWYSEGFDCPGSRCTDRGENQVLRPYEKVSEWIQKAPYRSRHWNALEVEKVLEVSSRFH